jgi:YVTN family beta-propeller protein
MPTFRHLGWMITTHLLTSVRAALFAGVIGALPLAAQGPVTSGTVLVADQQSGTATIVDVATHATTALEVGSGPHETVISPDGKWGVVTIYGSAAPNVGNKLAVIDLAAKKVVRTIDLGQYTRPHGASFVPGQPTQVVVTSEATSNVVLVDIAKGEVIAAIPTKRPLTHMLGVTADGKRVFAAAINYGGVVEIDLAKREFVRDLKVATKTEGIGVAPDGNTVWVGSNDSGTVSVVDTKTWTVAAKITGLVMPYRIGLSPDGKLAVFCDPQANKIWIADVATRKLIGDVGDLASPRGVKIATDNRTAFVTMGGDNTVVAIDLVTRAVLWKASVGKSPDGVWYGPKP